MYPHSDPPIASENTVAVRGAAGRPPFAGSRIWPRISGLLACVAGVLSLASTAMGQVTLVEGETYTYQFNFLPTSGLIFGNRPYGSVDIHFVADTLRPEDLLLYEMFEGTTNEAPVCSGQINLASANPANCIANDKWQDLQGSIRFTMSKGSATITHFVIFACRPGPGGRYPCSYINVTPTPSPPSVSTQPQSQTVVAGSTATFNVIARGTAPLSYQWLYNGVEISGETNASLVISNAQSTAEGNYRVTVTNAFGVITSTVAVLQVNPTNGTHRSGYVVSWGCCSNFFNFPVGLNDFVAVADGNQFILGLRSRGEVAAWGDPSAGVIIQTPPGLSDVMAIASGAYHGLALLRSETIVGWGSNQFGQTNIPPDLTNVTAIASGLYHSLALTRDRNVVAWGYSTNGETEVPMSVTNAVAIGAGSYHSLAVRENGTVVAWGAGGINSGPEWNGRQSVVPNGLTNVVTVAGGGIHSVALRNDGTIVAWGDNSAGQTDIPPNITNAVAIACGDNHSVVLMSDGKVAAWGRNDEGQTDIPPGLSNVVGISAAYIHSSAVVGDGSPVITIQPFSRAVSSGRDVALTTLGVGHPPLFRQWRMNGTNIPGATNSTLVLTNVQSANAGHYSMMLSNAIGAAVSAGAELQIAESAPLITVQPRNQTATAGTSTVLAAAAVGTSPLSFQWRLNGTNLSGATDPTLTIQDVQLPNDGVYTVVVTNDYGAVTSSIARLLVRFSLTILTNGAGTTTPNPMLVSYPPNFVVALSATPATGFSFADWSGDASGTNNPTSVIMTSNRIITANFAPVLTIGVQGAGIVTTTPSKPYYAPGEKVLATATPERWHSFTQWNDGVTDNPRPITIGANNNYSAIFSPTTALETLTFSNTTRVAPMGMPAILIDDVFATSASVTNYDVAEVQLVSSFPDAVILFTLDGSTPGFGSTFYNDKFVLRRNATLRAIAYSSDFTQSVEADTVELVFLRTHSLSIRTDGGGTVASSPSAARHVVGSSVTLNAEPAPGWKFLQWLGDVSGTNPIETVSMKRDLCVEAMFGTASTSAVVGSGTVMMAPHAPLLPYGVTQTLTAVPDSGSYFTVWGGAGSGTNNPLRISITNAAPSVTAVFQPLPANHYSLAVISDGFGTVTNRPRGNRFLSGTTVSLTAVAEAGQTFLGWAGDATGTQNPLTVTMDSSKVIIAQFTKRPTLTVPSCAEPSLVDGFRFLISGEFGAPYRMEKSENGQSWLPLATITNLFGVTQFTDTTATNAELRMYRAAPLGP